MRFSGKFERRFPVCLDRDFRLLKPIIDGRNLGVVVIVGEFRNMRGIPDRRIMVSGYGTDTGRSCRECRNKTRSARTSHIFKVILVQVRNHHHVNTLNNVFSRERKLNDWILFNPCKGFYSMFGQKDRIGQYGLICQGKS